MKNYILLLLILLGVGACSESELTQFSEPDAIYFQLKETDFNMHYSYWDDWLAYKGDSLIFTFGGIPKESESYKTEDTLWIQVNNLGTLPSHERFFKVSVNSQSTAEEGVHYQSLESAYEFPIGEWYTSFPVVFYNHESLGETPYTLHLDLEQNEHFILGLEGRTSVRIQIYNDVVEPQIWDQYLYTHLGPYSKAKHRVILLTNGGRVLPHTSQEYNAMGGYYNIYYMRGDMNAYLKANEVYDENGERIQPW